MLVSLTTFYVPGGAPEDLVLPDDWEMKFTEAGDPYYENNVSNKIQWQHPAIASPQNHQALERKRALAFPRAKLPRRRKEKNNYE